MDPGRLQAVISAELAHRRSEVVGIDPRLAASVDLLIGFVNEGGKRLRPEFLWCGWLAAGGSDDDTSETDAILECPSGALRETDDLPGRHGWQRPLVGRGKPHR